jgi:hypothetical protein
MLYPHRVAKVVGFLLRIPEDLLAEIRTLAKREQRSVSGQIVYMLRHAIESVGH